jgi:general secretion pathway protein F
VPLFSYRATTFNGAIVEGAIEAVDEAAAVDKLKNSGVIPLKIGSPEKSSAEKGHFRLGKKAARDFVLNFTTELSALLGAGLPLDRSLNILSEISGNREMKVTIHAILKAIREGSSFSDALERHPRYFSSLYISMIRAGEAGGVLDVVLDKLNEFLESAKELKDSVVSALIYPTILVCTGGISIIILLTYILPRFSVIFDELGGSLPLPTKVLLGFSGFMKSYWWIILACIVGLILVFRSYIRTDRGSFAWDSFKLRMTGEIIRKLETARFTRTLGTLLKSGVPLLQALVNARDVISNKVVASSIDGVMKGAKEGKGIAVPLAQTKVFPALALSMIKVGEETGQLDGMLIKTAETYEKALRVEVRRFMGLLEPALILGMGVVIGFIVVSMLLAIFSITELPF